MPKHFIFRRVCTVRGGKYIYTLPTSEEFDDEDMAYFYALGLYKETLAREQVKRTNLACALAARKFRQSPCPCTRNSGLIYLDCCNPRVKGRA